MAEPIDLEDLAAEVAGSNFTDERLNKRLEMLVSVLGIDPSKSLPKSFDGAGLEAAYRFFGNPRVTPLQILKPHFDATRTRCEQQGDYLIAHDSTSFSYRYDGDREGLGRAQRSSPRSNQSFHAHLSLAITDDEARRPLGIAAFKTWTRGATRSGIEFDQTVAGWHGRPGVVLVVDCGFVRMPVNWQRMIRDLQRMDVNLCKI